MCFVLLSLLRPALAQQPPAVPPAAQPAPGQPFAPAAEAVQPAPGAAGADAVDLRIQFVILDQYSYDTHPFFQITQDTGFSNAKASSAFFYTVGTRKTDQDANLLIKLLHALPPFGVEGIRELNLPFPRGIGFGLDSFVFEDKDTSVAQGVSTVIPIEADTYFISGVLRFYFFNPREPGVNYFVGRGLGQLNGTIRAAPFTGQDPEFITFSQNLVGSTWMGLETKGENWGFRYELIFINASEVILNSNPYPAGGGRTEISYSGSIVRLAIFAQF